MVHRIMGSNEVYNLRWNDYQVTLSNSVGTLLDDSDFIDVTLACDGQSFSAHKVVLSSCSSYLKKLLKRNPCKHPIVILKDIRAQILNFLIKFMYHGAVDVPEDQLTEFLSAAQGLEVRGLAEDDVPVEHQRHPPHRTEAYSVAPVVKKPRLSEPPSFAHRKNTQVVSAERARTLVKSAIPEPKNDDKDYVKKFSCKDVSITPTPGNTSSRDINFQSETKNTSAFQSSSRSNNAFQSEVSGESTFQSETSPDIVQTKVDDVINVKQEDYESDLEIMDPDMSIQMEGSSGSFDEQAQFSQAFADFGGEGSAGPSQFSGSMDVGGSLGRRSRIGCSYCHLDFATKYQLKVHIQRKHEVRPIEEWDECPVCTRRFKTKANLKTHLLQTHHIRKKITDI